MTDAVVTVEQMRAAEQAAMDRGISEWELMSRAGEGAAQWVARMAGGRSVCVLCGPGNNGGDGYVIAQALKAPGHEVTVVAPMEPKGDVAQRARDGFTGDIENGALPAADVYVDCFFGYGLSRKVEGRFGELLEALELSDGFKIAIDVPSMVESDSGVIIGPGVEYDLTLALGAWKRAHFAMPAMGRMGAKRLIDIGLSLPETAPVLSSPPNILPPATDAHKYKRGLLAVVAGEMPGAPLIACKAAMRSGAGYVKLMSGISHPDVPADLVTEDGELSHSLSDARISSILVGPGLGRGELGKERLSAVLGAKTPAILDADALHLLDHAMLQQGEASRLGVTPHEGELDALCEAFGISARTKLSKAQALQAATGITVLAKGPDSVLVGDEGVRFFPQASSWLSVAGSGDVLAGIAASRLAVHGSLFRALEEAVWLHREAAILAGPVFTASDLARAVQNATEVFS